MMLMANSVTMEGLSKSWSISLSMLIRISLWPGLKWRDKKRLLFTFSFFDQGSSWAIISCQILESVSTPQCYRHGVAAPPPRWRSAFDRALLGFPWYKRVCRHKPMFIWGGKQARSCLLPCLRLGPFQTTDLTWHILQEHILASTLYFMPLQARRSLSQCQLFRQSIHLESFSKWQSTYGIWTVDHHASRPGLPSTYHSQVPSSVHYHNCHYMPGRKYISPVVMMWNCCAVETLLSLA